MKEHVRYLGLMMLCLTMLGCASMSSNTASLVDFQIAGGQTVKCAVTDAGPLPAQNGPYTVEVAGLAMARDESGENSFIFFTFGITVARGGPPNRIMVEDVSGDKAVVMVDDKTPQIVNRYWKGNASPVVISEDSTPWIFEDKPTTKIFRITVSAKDTPDVVLYQPSWFAPEMKRSIAQWAKTKS